MRSLRIVVVGGGPGGLFLARLCRHADPGATVTVHERNGAADAFGFGVVFSDRTMSAFRAVDPETHGLITDASVLWTDMELRLGGTALRYGGYGFTAISRRALLKILQRQAIRAGARVLFGSPVAPSDPEVGQDADVVVVADGAGSTHRAAMADVLGARVERGLSKYIWFGTEAGFDAVTFPFIRNEHGAFAAHAYPYGGGMSTFIVETDEKSWLAAGMDTSSVGGRCPGGTDEYSRQYLTALFAEHLGGAELVGNKSKWANFRVVHNESWWYGSNVLLGDAAHTAHFSVGSGTKLAMEDAISLSAALVDADNKPAAFARYHRERGSAVARTQSAAAPSMRWWETFGRRLSMPHEQFGLHFITRTGAISYSGLRRRHADRIVDAERAFATGASHTSTPGSAIRAPFRLGPVRLDGRLVNVFDGTLTEEDALVTACEAAGSALLLADCTGTPWPASGVDWMAVAARHGCLFGVLLGGDHTGEHPARLIAAGASLLGAPADGRDDPIFARLRDIAGEQAAVVAILERLDVDEGTAWSAGGDHRVEHCLALHAQGVDGIYLRSPRGGLERWPELLEESERIRTESGLPVLVDGSQNWDSSVLKPDADDWSTRLHIAVVTGRTDLIVASPLSRPLATACAEISFP